ncbi:type II secretion system protein [Caenispirillum salinarum]|uniref:type II secretion system protein n=1 Tax=Caenispirillum salinarum TaxID=859058 RepID=UPI00384BEBF2
MLKTFRERLALKRDRQSQKGFTLIELSIVLVIIGLLIGGVIKGQDLIDSTKSTKLATEFDSYVSAFQSYRERFRAAPGDDNVDRFGTTETGNGNGVINGGWGGGAGTESRNSWTHLRAAGFIPFSPGISAANPMPDDDAVPVNTFGGDVQIIQAAGNAIGLQVTVTGLLCMDAIPGKAAATLDAKLDDGTANGGRIRASIDAGAGPAAPAGAAYPSEIDHVVCMELR